MLGFYQKIYMPNQAKTHKVNLPSETNSNFAPENGWLEYDRFLLGRLGLFSGAKCLFTGV